MYVPVLEIAAAINLGRAGDTAGGTAVGHAVGEGRHGGGFVLACFFCVCVFLIVCVMMMIKREIK
jgi:hypothetical protein